MDCRFHGAKQPAWSRLLYAWKGVQIDAERMGTSEREDRESDSGRQYMRNSEVLVDKQEEYASRAMRWRKLPCGRSTMGTWKLELIRCSIHMLILWIELVSNY